MNNTLNRVLWFAAGAIVGIAATNYFFKTKYERLYQEEVESVKRAFSTVPQSEQENSDDEHDNDREISNYAAVIGANEYGDSSVVAESIRKEVKGVPRPYVISPADFATEDDYEAYSLNYYADGILADEQGNVIEDVDGMVGRDSLNHFGEYEDDSVHVRNDALQCDFEILRDLSRYSDVYHNGPRPDED